MEPQKWEGLWSMEAKPSPQTNYAMPMHSITVNKQIRKTNNITEIDIPVLF